ncbi:MAG: glutathione peroxidase [Pirellulaceae bacterium]|nr:glutathione peroxidase [Pirellulaceae bacterium]
MQTIYDFSATSITGETVEFSAYRGRVILIVNVASRCHYTTQYEGLESLYQKYREAGLVIFGFPCGQFLNQEPGSSAEIQEFCTLKYNVSFPMFEKIDVNGPKMHPLYAYLKSQAAGWFGVRRIGWNFTKFLIDRKGSVICRYSTMTTPSQLENDIKRLI